MGERHDEEGRRIPNPKPQTPKPNDKWTNQQISKSANQQIGKSTMVGGWELHAACRGEGADADVRLGRARVRTQTSAFGRARVRTLPTSTADGADRAPSEWRQSGADGRASVLWRGWGVHIVQ